MYLMSLKEEKIPWYKSWNVNVNYNGITGKKYRGINELLLTIITEKEKYSDPRWYTFLQIKSQGWKLKNAKGKGVPIEFWSCYDKIKKCVVDYSMYKEIIQKYPEREKDFSVIRKVSCVYNASIIDGVSEYKSKRKEESIPTEKYISNIIKNIKVSYKEEGEKSYYNYEKDQIVLPPSNVFDDKYSYYATQLHELCHASGSSKRLNRPIANKFGTKDYAKEELVAEIGASFLMSNLNVEVGKKNYNNHKGYIQSWIEILENNPNELFKAINEANKVYDYLDKNSTEKNKEKER